MKPYTDFLFLKGLFIVLGCVLSFSIATAQKLNVEYRTAADSNARIHYLTFTDKSHCKVRFPARNHGDAMIMGIKNTYAFNYRIVNDTISFFGGVLDSVPAMFDRFRRSRFVFTPDENLFDTISGYTYIDDRRVSDKYMIYVVNGTLYRQRANKVNGYGFVSRSYKANPRLRRKLKGVKPDRVTITVLKGKQAYDKYGVAGMNGVIEIEDKK